MGSLTIEVRDHIAIVTLDRPPINALVKATYLEIQETFNKLGDMEGVRVAIFRSAGRFFCPGNDVSEFDGLAAEPEVRAYGQAVSDGISSVYSCKVPVVAAVHGHAMGAGMALAACADVIVASDKTQFGIPEIKVGVIGASGFLALLVPEKVARYLSLTGKSISSHEVERYGGVHKVVATEDVFDAAMEVAQDLLKQGPTALRYFKEAMNTNHDARLVEKYATESGYTRQYVGTAEANESVQAFLEGREPDYR